jgi:hypothetical protein
MIVVPNIGDQPRRRVKLLAIAPGQMVEWFKCMSEPRTYSVSGLPCDARVLACECDIQRGGRIRLLIESESFPELVEGSVAEEFSLYFTEHRESVALHR